MATARKGIDWARLADHFHPTELEWRVAQSGEARDRNTGEGKIWAKVLCYMTSRAVMDRLDEVVGPANWRVRYEVVGATLACHLAIKVDGEWIEKQDGTGLLEASGGLGQAEAGKGDYSLALKRAAVCWGIGRYLYRLPEAWAKVHPGGKNFAKTKSGSSFKWDPPELPGWALPQGATNVDPGTGEVLGEGPGEDMDQTPEEERPGKPGAAPWDRNQTEDLALLKERVRKLLDAVVQHENSAHVISASQVSQMEEVLKSGTLDKLRNAGEWLSSLSDRADRIGVR